MELTELERYLEPMLYQNREQVLFDVSVALTTALKTQVDEDTIEREVAQVVFAEVKHSLGAYWTNPFKAIWAVSVSYGGQDMEVEVEASDEEDAIDIVRDAITIESPRQTFTIHFDNDNTLEIEQDDEECEFMDSVLDKIRYSVRPAN
jgi:hypothetical protein